MRWEPGSRVRRGEIPVSPLVAERSSAEKEKGEGSLLGQHSSGTYLFTYPRGIKILERLAPVISCIPAIGIIRGHRATSNPKTIQFPR